MKQRKVRKNYLSKTLAVNLIETDDLYVKVFEINYLTTEITQKALYENITRSSARRITSLINHSDLSKRVDVGSHSITVHIYSPAGE